MALLHLFALAFAAYKVVAQSCKIESGQAGTCVSTSSCKSSGGSSQAGHCPGPTDIQCCTYGTCSVNGQSGLCQPTSSCSDGNTHAGYCPGPDDIQCCTYGSCSVNGKSGTCELTGLCSGSYTAGFCPGPSDIQCCTSSSSGSGSCTPPGVNSATLSLIKQYEGWIATPYLDSDGNPTIGWGHLCDEDSCADIGYPIPLSTANGEKLLQSDLRASDFLSIAQNCITKDISNNVKLNPNQYGALCSWAFNVGCGNVGSSTLVKDLNAGQNPDTVAEQQLPLWDHGSGDEVLPGLQTRRAAEVKLFTTPTSGQAHPPSCYSRTGRNFARIVMVRKFDA